MKSTPTPEPPRRLPHFSAFARAAALAVPILAHGSLFAQQWDADERRPARGLSVENFSVSNSYYNVSGFTRQANNPFASYGTALPLSGSDVLSSVSATITWALPKSETSGFTLTYLPSYSSYVKNSRWNAFNQSLLISGGRPLRMSSRASLNFSLSAGVQDFRQYMFAPSAMDSAVSTPSTMGELSAALSGGQVSAGSQLAAYLTGSPSSESASRAVVYGDRVFSGAVQTGLNFQWTSRLSLDVDFGLQRNQHLSSPQLDGAPTSVSLVPQATSGSLGARLSYSLSPRTNIGVHVNETRAFSSLQDTYSTSTMAFVTRNLSRRWFVSLHGGAGFYSPVSTATVYTPPSGAQTNAIASTGFKTYAHTFAATYQRTFADNYGVGGNAQTANGSWTWRVPGSSWWISAGAGRQQFTSSDFANLVSWRGSAGVSHTLGSSCVARVQYSYVTYSGRYAGEDRYRMAQTGVRFSISWMPRFNLF